MNIETFIKELKNLNINVTNQNLKDLEIYKDKLLEYNQKFNLTAIKQENEIYLKHFYDSLTLTKVIDLNQNLKIMDIGTGAGFPGLVLKIFYPNLDIVLVDSNHKKIEFLENLAKTLKLTKIKCIVSRAEDLPEEYREYFDIITSRAVSHLRILLELSFPYLKVNGHFLPMKGKLTEELEESKSTLKVLDGQIEKEIDFNLPLEGSTRTILDIKKTKPTKGLYPRRYDQIKKKVLK